MGPYSDTYYVHERRKGRVESAEELARLLHGTATANGRLVYPNIFKMTHRVHFRGHPDTQVSNKPFRSLTRLYVHHGCS